MSAGVAAIALLAGPGLGSPSLARTRSAIPFLAPPAGNQILVQARLGGRGPFTVLLDTGNAAPYTILLAPRAAARAGATPRPAPPLVSRAVVGAEPVTIRAFALASVELGPVRLTGVSAGVTPAIERASAALDRPVDALIGYRFLAGRVVAIDYPCRLLDLAAAPPRALPSARFTLAPLRPLTLVAVTVNGRGPFRFALDTGAAMSILSPATARAAGVRSQGPAQLAGAGGTEAGVTAARATLALGRAPGRRLDLVVSALVDRVGAEAGAAIDGIAGAGLFAGARLILDYRGGRLWLAPARRCRR